MKSENYMQASELMDVIKKPPHSRESEQSVLGALMLDNNAFDDVADILTAADFYELAHRRLFSAIQGLAKGGNPFDAVTLFEWLDGRKEAEDVGGLSYIGKIANNVPTAANVKAYAMVVRDYAVERNLIRAGNEISATGYGQGSTAEKLDHAQSTLMQIIEDTVKKTDTETVGDVMQRVLDNIEKASVSNGDISGLKTGFAEIDRKIDGLHPGEFIIVAGRSSMGKTTLVTNIARNVALSGDCVMIFSLEMPSDQILMREVSAVSRIEFSKLRSGRLQEHEWRDLTRAVGVFNSANLIMDNSFSLGLMELRAKARREMRKRNIKLIIIDYLQLMRTEKSQNRTQEIGALSRGLKQLARELNIPVIALSQLNRSPEARANKRPIMSDLRESGDIEQDADLIMMLYRDEYYNPESEWAGITELIITKQRNGPTGMIPLSYSETIFRFDDFTGNLPSRSARQKKPGMWIDKTGDRSE